MTRLSSLLCLPVLAAGLMFAEWAGAQAPESAPPAAAAPTADEAMGTTIVGDKETPMGLYLTPWKNVHPDRSLDRPPQLLAEELTPVDPKVFNRRTEYYNLFVLQRSYVEKSGAASGK
jgi:hypothetical protein